MQAFITVSGVLQLNYNGLPELTGGETVEELEVPYSFSNFCLSKITLRKQSSVSLRCKCGCV